MKKIVFLCCAIGLVLRVPAIAEETIGLAKAVSIALENNSDYNIAKLKVKAAEESVNAAWGMLMPSLESEASLVRQGAESGFMALSDGQYDIKIVQLRFGINPGNFYHMLQGSRKQHIIAMQELRRIKSETEYRVIKAYFDVILARDIEKMKKDSLSLYAENLKDVKNLYKTGTVPRYELLQAQVQHKSLEVQVLDAESKSRLSIDYFNYALGVKDKKYIPDEAVLNAPYPKPCEGEEAINMLSKLALENRPEIMQISLKGDAIRHKKNAIASAYLWPTFSIGGWYGKTKLLPNEVDLNLPPSSPFAPDFSSITGNDAWQTTWQIRVAATYRWGSLLPVDPAKSLSRMEEAELKAAQHELENLTRLIGLSIRSSHAKLLTASLSIDSQKEGVALAEEGLRIARESYKAGVIKNSELIAAEYALTAAKTGLITSLYNYHTAVAELRKELGTEDAEIIFREKAK